MYFAKYEKKETKLMYLHKIQNGLFVFFVSTVC